MKTVQIDFNSLNAATQVVIKNIAQEKNLTIPDAMIFLLQKGINAHGGK